MYRGNVKQAFIFGSEAAVNSRGLIFDEYAPAGKQQ